MKILDPQSATLTNAEVLAHLALNPPRRSPNPPPNARNFTPKPDLRDHNTVIKEFHNYVSRLSPHLLQYPAFSNDIKDNSKIQEYTGAPTTGPPAHLQDLNAPTPFDIALRNLITDLKPFNLTKAEVLMIVNLGIGLSAPENPAEGEEQGGAVAGADGDVDMSGANGDAEEGEGGDGDYGALALMDTVIEDREERLSDEDCVQILNIVKRTLGGSKAD